VGPPGPKGRVSCGVNQLRGAKVLGGEKGGNGGQANGKYSE